MWTSLFVIALTIFLAELGDKTQLATVLFATDEQHSPWLVFAAASFGLVASSAIAVLLGHFAAKFLTQIPLKLIAGIGFLFIGGWNILDHFRS